MARKEKGLTEKQQEQLLQDLENMLCVNMVITKFLEEKGLKDECQKYVKEQLKGCEKKVN